MSARPAAVLAAACVLMLTLALAPSSGAQEGAEPQDAAEPPDSLRNFLRGLSHESDAYFGETTSEFDTTGIDSLYEVRKHDPLELPSPDRPYFEPMPRMRYDRQEGYVLGASFAAWTRAIGRLEARVDYGFGMKAFRNRIAWKRILWYQATGGFLNRRTLSRNWTTPGASLLGVEVAYGRDTEPFAPEHERALTSHLNSFFVGTDRQSYYERSGWMGLMHLRLRDWDFVAGVRDAHEKPMPKTATFVVFRDGSKVPGVTRADPDEYTEGFGGVRFYRSDWDVAFRLEGRAGRSNRWRTRAALAKGLRLGRSVRAFLQVEGGASAAQAPVQRRFQLGGPAAVPTLGFGIGDNSHLLLGKLDFMEAHDLLEVLRLPHPDWLNFHPGVFFHYAAAWDDPAARDIVFSKPPSTAWRGAAGVSLIYRPGLPDPRSQIRFQMGWPVGPEGGVSRFTVSIGREFDLVSPF